MKQINIIGGGITGLTLSYELQKLGYSNIHIYEKKERVGGRIKSFEKSALDSGAFMVFAWYDNFRELLHEIGLDNSLLDFKFSEVFYKIDSKEYITQKEFEKNIDIKTKLKFVKEILKQVLIDKNTIYDYKQIGKFKTLKDYIDSHFGFDSIVEELLNLTLASYGYPDISKLPPSLLCINQLSVFRGWIKNCQYIKDGTATITEALAKIVIDRGCTIYTNYEYALSEKPKDNITVVATPELVREYISFTKFNSYLLEFENDKFPFKDWFITYYKDSNQNYFSLYNPEAEPTKNIPTNQKVLYADSSVDISILNTYLPQNKITSVVETEEWYPIMPYSSISKINELQKLQGVNGIYYAGDYLHGLPSMETAVYSAKTTAARINIDMNL